jgi:branched-chain amino acid transport system substrate-binding protein
MRIRTIAAGLLAALGLAVAGCGGGSDGGGSGGGGGGGGSGSSSGGGSAPCTASIGIMAPITGEAAQQGGEQLHFAQLAVDQFNQRNGTRFTLVQGDTQLDPGQASTVAQQFASNDKILGVVGPAGSQEVEAVGPVFERRKLAFVSQSATSADLTTSGKYPTFFRVVPPDSVQGPTDGRYIAQQLKPKKVLVVDDQTSYSTGIAQALQQTLQQAGVTVARDSVRQDQNDFSALVAKITPDTGVVFLPWQLAANAQLFGKQMQEQGKKATIFGSDGLFSPDDFNIDGSYVSSFAPDITRIPAARDVAAAYRKRYGQFGTFGPPTYVATQVVMTAIQQACKGGEPSREAVTDAVKTVRLPDSILGRPISFTPQGDLTNPRFYIFQVRKGKFVLVR